MSTTFSTLDIIRNHRLKQTSGLFSGATKVAGEAPTRMSTLSSAPSTTAPYHGVSSDSEPATIEKNSPKPISGGISGSTSLVSPPKPVFNQPTGNPALGLAVGWNRDGTLRRPTESTDAVYDLPHGSPGLGLEAGTRTDGSAMSPPPDHDLGPGVTGITEGYQRALRDERAIADARAYNAERFPTGASGVSPEMIAQFRRRTGSNYNPNSRMDQHNMQLITAGGQTVNTRQFRAAPSGLLAKTATINRIKDFLGVTKTAFDFEPETEELADEASQSEQEQRANREANPSISDRFIGAASKVKSDFLQNALSGMTVGGAMGSIRGVVENQPTHTTLRDVGAAAALGGIVGAPLLSLVSAMQGFHSPPKKTAAFDEHHTNIGNIAGGIGGGLSAGALGFISGSLKDTVSDWNGRIWRTTPIDKAVDSSYARVSALGRLGMSKIRSGLASGGIGQVIRGGTNVTTSAVGKKLIEALIAARAMPRTLAGGIGGAALGAYLGGKTLGGFQRLMFNGEKTAAFADGMISKYVLPRAGLFLRNTGANLKWMGQQAGRLFKGAKPDTLAAVNAPFNAEYQALQNTFTGLPMAKQIAYGAAKRGAGYVAGTTVGAGTAVAAINGFSGAINDKKKEEIGKAIGTARNTIHTAMSDPSTRLKLGLSALFAPGAATSHIDDILSKIETNATA